MEAHLSAHAPAHLRLLSFAAAGAICGALTYFAFTGKFAVISEFIDDAPIMDVFVEQHEPPPAPPPVQIKINPPPVQHAEPDTTQPPTFTETVFEEAPPQPPAILTGARFLERPSGRDFARYYPNRALERGQEGRVLLRCTVGGDGGIACNVASETPAGWGFGDASLRAAAHFHVAAMTADGRPTSGGVLEVPMVWRTQ